MRKNLLTALFILCCIAFIVGCTSPASPTATAQPATGSSAITSTDTGAASASDGKTLLESRCVSCHTLARIVNQKASADQWKQVVDQMIQRGAVLNANEETVLVQYLADNFK